MKYFQKNSLYNFECNYININKEMKAITLQAVK